jgi:hypothetical protein
MKVICIHNMQCCGVIDFSDDGGMITLLLKRKELTDMIELEKVLHKPTLPANDERWHILLQRQPEELLDALSVIARHEQGVIQTAEWKAEDQLLICLCWIDGVMPKFIETDVLQVSFNIIIKHNGREPCHGHNMSPQT